SGFDADRASISIWAFAIENFVSPKHHDHFIVAHVSNVMRPPWNGFDDFWLLARGEKFIKLTRHDVTETETSLAFDDQELFRLGVVIVPATSDTGMGSEE